MGYHSQGRNLAEREVIMFLASRGTSNPFDYAIIGLCQLSKKGSNVQERG